MLWGIFLLGLGMVVENAIAFADITHRARRDRVAGHNGEIALVYARWRRLAFARLVVGGALVGAGWAPFDGMLRIVVFGVGVLGNWLSIADYRSIRQNEQLAAARLRRLRQEGHSS